MEIVHCPHRCTRQGIEQDCKSSFVGDTHAEAQESLQAHVEKYHPAVYFYAKAAVRGSVIFRLSARVVRDAFMKRYNYVEATEEDAARVRDWRTYETDIGIQVAEGRQS